MIVRILKYQVMAGEPRLQDSSCNQVECRFPPVLPFKASTKISDIQLIRLLPQMVVESSELPGIFHGDPADRILAATARILELTLATILAYGKTHRVHTLKI